MAAALVFAHLASLPAIAQTSGTSSASSKVTAPYPEDGVGIFIQDSDWTPIPSTMPFKTHAKHAFAASLSYGAVPATIVADYDGPHAAVSVRPGRPVICICHLISLPGEPVLVKLHPKKKFRELDGGHLRIMSGKIAEAEKNDIIPGDISQPESAVWLVRPKQPLPPGEYALMLGTQNINIFPFTVSAGATTSSTAGPGKS